MQYTYDQNGNMKTMTYPSGRVITYNYSNDRAVSVLTGAASLASNITYKPFGGMSSLTYGNGIVGSIGYDNQYRITSIAAGAGSVMNLSYNQYDANANIQHITDTLDPAKNKTFVYDALDRLTSGTGSWGSLGWTYDGVGNRQTENSNSYSYVSNTNKLSSANGKSFGYDNNGNTTSEAARQYIYNQNQRLTQVNDGATTAYYTYNGNGQRVKKIVGSTTTIFHYSLSGQLIAESNSSGNITAEYVYLNGQPLAKMEGSGTYYYHNDHLATPQKITNSTGQVVWAADYKPFGEATVTVSTITNNLRFPGQYYDAETGLNYNYFRDYNPAIGRYPDADRLGLIGGINLYAYVRNRPINRVDPRGLMDVDPTGFYNSSSVGPSTVNWGQVGTGAISTVGGVVGIATAASVGVGSAGSGLAVSAGISLVAAPALSYGVSQMIAGFIGTPTSAYVPDPNLSNVIPLAITGDPTAAAQVNFAVSTGLLFLGDVPSSLANQQYGQLGFSVTSWYIQGINQTLGKKAKQCQ